MLSRHYRFHGHNSLNFTYRQGRTVRGQQLSLRFSFNPRRRNYRVAVVVSKKISKSAVVRNRIRRRIYEIIRTSSTPISSGYDLVITVHDPSLALIEHDKLAALVNGIFERAKLI